MRGSQAGQGGSSRGPRAARQGPRGVRRLLAALDLLHGRPRHQLGRRGRLRRRRLPPASRRRPDQRIHPPAPLRVPLTFLPDEGESEPALHVGDQPRAQTLGSSPPVAWSFSPARLNAVGAGPAASRGPRRARLHYVEREDPGGGHPNRAGDATVLPGAALRHARSQAPGAVSCGTRARQAPAVARTPFHKPVRNGTRNSPAPLDNFFLRWFLTGSTQLEPRHRRVLASGGDRCGGLLVMLAEHAHHGGRRGMLAFLLGPWRSRAAGDVSQAHFLPAQVERGGEHRFVGDGGAADRLAPGTG